MNEMRWGGGMGEQSSTPEPVRERQSLPRGRDCLSRRILRGTCQRWRNPRTHRSRRRGSCSWPSLFGHRSSAIALRPSLFGRRSSAFAACWASSASESSSWCGVAVSTAGLAAAAISSLDRARSGMAASGSPCTRVRSAFQTEPSTSGGRLTERFFTFER